MGLLGLVSGFCAVDGRPLGSRKCTTSKHAELAPQQLPEICTAVEARYPVYDLVVSNNGRFVVAVGGDSQPSQRRRQPNTSRRSGWGVPSLLWSIPTRRSETLQCFIFLFCTEELQLPRRTKSIDDEDKCCRLCTAMQFVPWMCHNRKAPALSM